MKTLEHFQKGEASPFELRNLMQVELAKRHCIDCSNTDLFDWVFNELSPKFAKLLTKDPELLNKFAIDPEGALKEVEAQLELHDGKII